MPFLPFFSFLVSLPIPSFLLSTPIFFYFRVLVSLSIVFSVFVDVVVVAFLSIIVAVIIHVYVVDDDVFVFVVL